MERKKPGPKPEKPLSKGLTIRLDAETRDILEAYCARNHKTLSQAGRDAILGLKNK